MSKCIRCGVEKTDVAFYCYECQQKNEEAKTGNTHSAVNSVPVMEVNDSMGTYHIADTHIEEQPKSTEHDHGSKQHPCHICDGGDDDGNVDCLACEKEMLKHLNNKKLVDIGIKDGCGQPVLMEEVGLGVGDKDCPDCKVDVGCAKHYIKDGDRHDRLEGALTPLGEATKKAYKKGWQEGRKNLIDEMEKTLKKGLKKGR